MTERSITSFSIFAPQGTDPERVRALTEAIEAIDPTFRSTAGSWSRHDAILNGLVSFAVALLPPDEDVLTALGSTLRYGPVLALSDPEQPYEPKGVWGSSKYLFRFDDQASLVAFVRDRIVRRTEGGSPGFWVEDPTELVNGNQVLPGEPVWFPCDRLWVEGTVTGIEDPGPWPRNPFIFVDGLWDDPSNKDAIGRCLRRRG